MPYKAHEKFIEDAKEKQNKFTRFEALKSTLPAKSQNKRIMKINLDGMKLAIDRLNGITKNDLNEQEL